MIIDRRSFIQGSAFIASASVLATLIPRSLAAQIQSVRSEQSADAAVESPVVFRIDGWNLDAERSEGNDMLIRINQSWRTAWR
jgi:hypothetical protein